MDILYGMLENPERWLSSDEKGQGIVVSSRIRLARNLADFPFAVRMATADREAVERRLTAVVKDCPDFTFHAFPMEKMADSDRQFLMERHLISREFAEGIGARSVMIAAGASSSVMINEEDHLRIQVIKPGFNLEGAWEEIDSLDDQIESRVVYAWHEQLGYLTACPTNVGTGMRVSLMLHLPALVLTKQFVRMHQSLQKISLIVRGLYGEGSQALGDFYQISNQATLGMAEHDILDLVGDVADSVIGYEMRARDHLLQERKTEVEAEIRECITTLRSAEILTPEDALHCLSLTRLGIQLGLVADIPMNTVNLLILNTQPAHLERIYGGIFSSLDANIFRAQYVQRQLKLL